MISSSSYLDISLISRSWENIRKPRVERIKSYAAWNTQMFLGNKHLAASYPKYPDVDWDSIKDIGPNSAADFTSPAFFKWAHEYDAVEQVSMSHLARVHSLIRSEKRMQRQSINTRSLTMDKTHKYLKQTCKASSKL